MTHQTPVPAPSSGLSPETWQKAQRELHEDPLVLDTNVQSVRDLIVTRPDVRFLRTDKEFVLRFLRAKKFDISESFKALARYFEARQKRPHLLAGLSAEDANIRESLLGGFPGVLANLDPFGRRILVFFAANWEGWLFCYTHVLQALVLSLEYMLEDPETQVNGFVVVIDWTGVTFKQVSSLTPATMKMTIEIFQDCFPGRLGGIHLINQPWYVEAAVTMCKPFLKESTRRKIHFHGNNLSTLHAKIHREMLPAELGGANPPYNHFSWAKTLIGCNFTPKMHNNDTSSHMDLAQLEYETERFALPQSKPNVATLEVSNSTEPKQTDSRPLISLE